MKSSPNVKQLREYGFLMGFSFPLFLGWLVPKIYGHNFALWTLFIGIPILIIGIIKPNLLSKPYKIWLSIGNTLGWINSHLILGLVFIFILQPIAFFMRINGYDPLRKKRLNKKSYYERKEGYEFDLDRIF